MAARSQRRSPTTPPRTSLRPTTSNGFTSNTPHRSDDEGTRLLSHQDRLQPAHHHKHPESRTRSDQGVEYKCNNHNAPALPVPEAAQSKRWEATGQSST